VTLDPGTSAKITGYRPRSAPPEWDLLAGHVRTVVAASAPMTGHRVERLLHVVARLAIWCHRRGLPADAEIWLRHETIDAFVLAGCTDLSPHSAQTYRSWLRQVRAALAWAERGEAPPAAMTAPNRPTAPYTRPELAGLLEWARSLRAQARCDALALIGLAAGCGLAPGELAAVRGTHLRILADGTVVIAPPGTTRLIVARAAYEDHLAAAARSALAGGDRYLFRPGRTVAYAKNLIASWTKVHRPTGDLPPLSARRLRASWIVELLTARIDIGVVAAAAGLAPSALARYQHFVPPLEEHAAIELLRGRR
jgi:integrase